MTCLHAEEFCFFIKYEAMGGRCKFVKFTIFDLDLIDCKG